MSALGFQTDPRGRLRRIVAAAIDGCAWVSAGTSADGTYLIAARRSDGRDTHLRFLGVQSVSEPTGQVAGATLRLRRVGGVGSPLRLLVPRVFRPGIEPSRVTIDADGSRFEVVCEDAEWWED